MRNNQVGDSVRVKVTATLLDSQATVLASASSFAYVEVLRPGRTSPFEVLFPPEVSAGTPNYQLEIVSEVAEEAKAARLVVEEHQGNEDDDGLFWVTGRVANAGDETVDTIAVVVTFYNDAGIPIAATLGIADAAPLAPGETSGFTLVVELPMGATVANYTVEAEAS